MAGWRRAGVDAVLSLLTREEEQDLDLATEAPTVKASGMTFDSFPIPDRHVPHSETALARKLEHIDADLSAGRNVVVHCRQGIGRAGLVASCLLLGRGSDVESAVERVSAARSVPVPETKEQRRWMDHYATALASIR